MSARAVVYLTVTACLVVRIVTGPTLLDDHAPPGLLVVFALIGFLLAVDELGSEGQRRREVRRARRRASRRRGYVR